MATNVSALPSGDSTELPTETRVLGLIGTEPVNYVWASDHFGALAVLRGEPEHQDRALDENWATSPEARRGSRVGQIA